MRAPGEASPPRKKRKAAEAERTEDAEFEAELQAALQESARLHAEGHPGPSGEERLRLALTEAAAVGINLSSDDEATPSAEAPVAEVPREPSPPTESQAEAPVTEAAAEAVPAPAPGENLLYPSDGMYLIRYEVDLSQPQPAEEPTAGAAETGSAPEVAAEGPEAPEEDHPTVLAFDSLVLPTVALESKLPPGPPKPVTTPVDAEAHRARVEEIMVSHAPEATSRPNLDLALRARRRAAAEKAREELMKKAGKGPSRDLKIGGQAREKTPEATDAESAKQREEARRDAAKRLRRLDKHPVFPDDALPRRQDKTSGRDIQASDVEYDLHAFAREPYVSEREGRPVGPARSSINPRDLDASLDRKMDHLQADIKTVLEDYRVYLHRTVKEGLIEAQAESFKEGKAVTDNLWFDRAMWAEAEVGRNRNLIFQTANDQQAARQTLHEAKEKIEEAKAEIEKAKEAEKAALEAKEAAKQLALEEARREVRDEVAGLRGQVMAADAVAADSQRRAKEHENAANEARKEAAEARKAKAEAEALVTELEGEVAKAETKAESAAQRADEAEKSLTEALAQVTASDKALAEAQGQLACEAEAKLSLQQALDAATEAAAQGKEASRAEAELVTEASARAEAAEKALADTRAQKEEVEERVQRLETALREANVLAESQQRRAEAMAARREVEAFNAALATIEADTPGFDLTDFYRIPDSPDPPVDGE